MKKINNQAQLEKMIRKYLSGKANTEEQAFLENYYEHFGKYENILDVLPENEKLALGEEMETAIMKKVDLKKQPKVFGLQTFIRVAAVVFLCLSAGIYFYSVRTTTADALQAGRYPNAEVQPGGNIASLTLADGRKILLDQAAIGELGREGNSIVRKSKDGQLIYDLSGEGGRESVSVLNNTLETPNGGEYQVILPDGTKVWLNAASKLTFPSIFEGKERRVELVGEAYFEVARNKKMPFLVSSAGQVVEVLGTHFNISAYPDEAVLKTTLLEGSVRVSKAGFSQSELLVPGQQSTIRNGGKILISAVNATNAIAWKNGYFVFANEGLESVMKKISRWYNIEVAYTGNVTKEEFVGSVSKFENISEVLAALELTGLVHFKIEGRRITVMP